jgi:hypothetical protein
VTPPKRLALPIVLVLVFALTGLASADSTSDPQGDLVDQTPCECSNYGQDLKSIDATQAGSDITFTITQYDSMNNEFAAAYYGPEVGIYTGGSATPTYGIIPRSDGQNHFKMTLVPAASFAPPCPGGTSYGQGVTSTYDAGFTSATYTIHLADIGDPGSFQWKVSNPGVPGCGVISDAKARDIAPDSGLLTFTAGGTGGGGGNTPPPPPPGGGGTTTPPPGGTTTPPPPDPSTGLTPAQTLPNLGGVPATQKLGGTVGGTLDLAGPASTVTFDLLGPGGGAANAAASKLIGHLVKTNVPKGLLHFKIKVNPKALKRYKRAKTVRVTLRVTVKLADGNTITRKTTIKLRRK